MSKPATKLIPVMKMYVWEDPYSVSYGSSLLIVVAESLPKARQIAKKSAKEKWPNFEVPLLKPTRIVSLPCVEWHEWSE